MTKIPETKAVGIATYFLWPLYEKPSHFYKSTGALRLRVAYLLVHLPSLQKEWRELFIPGKDDFLSFHLLVERG